MQEARAARATRKQVRPNLTPCERQRELPEPRALTRQGRRNKNIAGLAMSPPVMQIARAARAARTKMTPNVTPCKHEHKLLEPHALTRHGRGKTARRQRSSGDCASRGLSMLEASYHKARAHRSDCASRGLRLDCLRWAASWNKS